ncbi:anti-repressor SinI family protein [Alkalihalobacterium chitinilyticum]|uniref:Anti-repressor SinI family protein n=1 Tax=Alkalihalobacterium chitinilyticum TaxID=2980103 RepID=A0ABT5VGK3_9BACI|nr:anti-repressor SinI family protein [Alkalihalobacterium chitinilyticum]MDE5414588.1 anti-repressor SinI family protein [Alkalihalobacterium chitinilyticum]
MNLKGENKVQKDDNDFQNIYSFSTWDLDVKWRELVIEAMDSGVSKDEFRKFLDLKKEQKY